MFRVWTVTVTQIEAFGILFVLGLSKVTTSPVEETLKYRLKDLPERLHGISGALFPDGIPNQLLDFYVPKNVSSSLCRNHSRLYANEMENFTPWAVQMWDSSGKLPVGLFDGNFYHLGNFKECMRVVEISPFQVQQCLVQFGNIITPQKPPENWFQEEVDTITGGIPVLKERLTLAICLPSSCNLHDLQQHYEQVANHFNFTLHIDKYSCTKSDRKIEITAYDIFVFVILTTLFGSVFVATMIDVYFLHYFGEGFVRDIILAFSAVRNANFLLKTNNSFASIDGIRFLSVCWIMLSHHSLFDIVKPAINYIFMSQLYSQWYATIILNGILGVDNFIIINGVLLTYYFLINMKSGMKFNLPFFYLHRIMRVFPTYSVQVMMAMTIFTKLFSGPMWRYFVERHQDICHKNWWTNLLFINNYVNPDYQCIPSSWYLSVDMQLYILSPLILIPLYKWKRCPKYLISTLVIVGNIVSFSVFFYNKFPAGSVVSSNNDTARKHAGAYVTTHTRLGQWGVGIGLGFILFLNRGKQVKISKKTVSICWFLCIVCAAFIFQFVTYFHQDGVQSDRLLSSAYASLGTTAWALCVSWVIFASENGYGGPIGRFLSWKLFQPLSKLTYAIYLVHVGVEYVFLALIKSAGPAEIPFMIREMAGEMLISVLLSPVMYLVLETPFVNLERVVRKQFSGSQKNKSEEPTKKNGDSRPNENFKLVNKAFAE